MTDTCANTRSTTLLCSQRLKQVAWGTACGLMLLAVAHGSARAADDDDKNSIWNLDTRIYREFMTSLGLGDGSDESIDYRERSPLVVPPSRTLPPPETVRTQPSPAWPVDPDQKRRQEAAAAKAKRRSTPYDPEAQARNLLPSELNRLGPGPRPGSGGSNSATPGDSNGNPLPPSQLGYFGGLFSWSSLGIGQKEEVGTFTREPPRESLTAPPVGYQTPSAASPYGVTRRYDTKVTPLDPAVGSNGR